MRFMTAGAIAGAMILGAVTVGAQASMKFSGVKLVDMHAQTPETTVSVLVDPSGLSIVDPVHNSPIKSFKYENLEVTHTFASAPPATAGNPSAAPVPNRSTSRRQRAGTSGMSESRGGREPSGG